MKMDKEEKINLSGIKKKVDQSYISEIFKLSE